MIPPTVVDRLLPPTVMVFGPSLNVPAPSNEPAVVPLDVRPEKSNVPVAPAFSRAVPPLLVSLKDRCRGAWCRWLALPAVLLARNWRDPPMLSAALPAVLEPLNRMMLLLAMVALPAVLVLLKRISVPPLLPKMWALPAVLALLKMILLALAPPRLMEALPVVLVS